MRLSLVCEEDTPLELMCKPYEAHSNHLWNLQLTTKTSATNQFAQNFLSLRELTKLVRCILLVRLHCASILFRTISNTTFSNTVLLADLYKIHRKLHLSLETVYFKVEMFQPLVGHVYGSHDVSDLLHALQIWRDPALAAEDLVVHNRGHRIR